MKIESKFNIGDKVYHVSGACVEYPKVRVECDTCDTTGHITVKGKTYLCPECRGNYTEDYNNPKSYFPNPFPTTLTIGQVRTITTKDKTEIRYMCKETGIGSGTLYEETRLFSTYDEAIDFVKKANKELANGKHWSEIP